MNRYEVATSGIRLDVFLSEAAGITRSQAKLAIEENRVRLMGKPPDKAGVILRTGDWVEYEPAAPVPDTAEGEDIPITILYEDEHLAVVDKPQGMVVHPAKGNYSGTLVNALLFRMNLPEEGDKTRPGIVHRLDKNTSGVMIVAKTAAAHLALAKQIRDKSAGRIYRAILTGVVKADRGEIDAPIARSNKNRKKMAVSESGKPAKTLFTVLKRGKNHTYCEFQLLTGRTHQIRVHAAYMGHAVAADPEYSRADPALSPYGQLLHSYILTFTHPATGEKMSFTAPLPDTFSKALHRLLLD